MAVLKSNVLHISVAPSSHGQEGHELEEGEGQQGEGAQGQSGADGQGQGVPGDGGASPAGSNGADAESPEADEKASQLGGPDSGASEQGGAGEGAGEGEGRRSGDSWGDDGRLGETYTFDFGDGCISVDGKAPWYDQRGGIRAVSFGEGVRPKSMARWFRGLDKLETIDFCGLDTSQVSDMGYLFGSCSSLEALDLSSFNTQNVTSMAHMFVGCSGITSLDVSSFDTRNVSDMSGMFAGCESVTSLDLSMFDTGKVKDLDSMFEGCKSLAALDVSSFSAEQLSAASIPVANSGGFWKLNVPDGYEAGVTLRQPTAAERIAAGEPNPDAKEPDDRPAGEQAGERADESVATEPANGRHGEAGEGEQTGASGNVANADNAVLADMPADADAGVAAGLANAIQEGLRAMAAPTASSPSSSSAQAVVAAASYAQLETPALPAALVEALVGLSSDLVPPVAGPAVDPSFGLDQVMEVTELVMGAFGPDSPADKTLAMLVAGLGMVVAAGLMLLICLKIR